MQSIHSQLEDKILSLKKGTIVFVSDFAGFGTAENVKKVLLRLEKKQLLVRLAHGIYLYPKIDKDKCVECGKCISVCSFKNPIKK